MSGVDNRVCDIGTAGFRPAVRLPNRATADHATLVSIACGRETKCDGSLGTER
jgi:hypothetical protein